MLFSNHIPSGYAESAGHAVLNFKASPTIEGEDLQTVASVVLTKHAALGALRTLQTIVQQMSDKEALTSETTPFAQPEKSQA